MTTPNTLRLDGSNRTLDIAPPDYTVADPVIVSTRQLGLLMESINAERGEASECSLPCPLRTAVESESVYVDNDTLNVRPRHREAADDVLISRGDLNRLLERTKRAEDRVNRIREGLRALGVKVGELYV